ncbi:MAG TPA: hypothetical protein VIV56_05430 [Gemmatimonadales bacterium]|jgi:hypothetical protein
MRPIGQRRGSRGAEAVQPFVAGLLTDPGASANLDNAFPRRSMQYGTDELEAL